MSDTDKLDRIEPSKTALLVIDMQRFFVSPDYPFGKFISKLLEPAASEYYFDRVHSLVIPNIQRLLKQFRGANSQVVYTEFGSVRGTRDFPS